MTTAQDGGKGVTLMHRPPSPPGNVPGNTRGYGEGGARLLAG